MQFLRALSPWHRGYDKGYAAALRAVEGGLKMSVDLAKEYGHQNLDEATRAIASAFGGDRK